MLGGTHKRAVLVGHDDGDGFGDDDGDAMLTTTSTMTSTATMAVVVVLPAFTPLCSHPHAGAALLAAAGVLAARRATSNKRAWQVNRNLLVEAPLDRYMADQLL